MNEENTEIEKETGKQHNIASRLLSPIIEDGKLSVGRLMLVSTFVLAMIVWIGGKEIPNTMVTILITLIGYVITSKTVGTVKDVATKIKDTKTMVAKIKK